MNYLAIIPARYQSSRFPGKPLVEINGKPMIRRTWEQASKAIDNVVVATDDERIRRAVDSFGGMAIMTSPGHQSGTDRCAEAVRIVSETTGINYDVVINIQGDEPYIQPEQIQLLAKCFDEKGFGIATLVKRIDTAEEIFNPNLPKAIIDKKGFAIYFSRSPIPYVRGRNQNEWPATHPFFRHIGMYGFLTETLQEITRLEPSALERAESLEQNRWLENGYLIRVKETAMDTIAIDTPEDLEKI